MDCIQEYIEANFSEKRKLHTYAVRETAKALALHYGVDVESAKTAAMFHDLFRGIAQQTLNVYVKKFGLPEKYMNNGNLAHGKIAAIVMSRDYGIKDQDIINAVSYHTTGREGMSELEKVIYLADSIEPNRNYQGVEDLRRIAYEGLNEACIASMEKTIDFVTGQGALLDEDTLKAKEYLVKELEEKEKMNG